MSDNHESWCEAKVLPKIGPGVLVQTWDTVPYAAPHGHPTLYAENYPDMNSGVRADGGPSVVVLVAIEPRAYAHAIGTVIAELRPCLDIRLVEPPDIHLQVRRLNPDLVMCSRPCDLPANGGPSWVEYTPYAEPPEAEIRIDGNIVEQRGLSLPELVEIVDLMTVPKPTRNGHTAAMPGTEQGV